MTYQLNITIETSIPQPDVAEEVQAALGAWGIGSANAVVHDTLDEVANAVVRDILDDVFEKVSQELERCVAKDSAEGEAFCRRIKGLVDGYCYKNV
jgi:hypothetical protein